MTTPVVYTGGDKQMSGRRATTKHLAPTVFETVFDLGEVSGGLQAVSATGANQNQFISSQQWPLIGS